MSSTPGNGPQWDSEPTTGPDELEAGPVIEPNRFPRWIWWLVGVLLVALTVAGAVLAASRINRDDGASATASPSVVRTAWPMTAPLSVGAYSRDANAAAVPSTNPATQKQALATTYAKNGKNMVVLLQSRPEDDAQKFMQELGMNAIVANGQGWCGTSIESNRDACAVVRDNTAIAVSDLAGLTRTDLMTLTEQFADALAKG